MSISIIVTCWNQKRPQDHISMLCLDHVRRYTDPPYQLIVVDPVPVLPIRDDYKTLRLENDPDTMWLKPKIDPGYTGAMNVGASHATGDILVFLQNDVFVPEGWLPNMRWYIDHGLADCVIPDQCPRDREFVKNAQKMTMEEGMKYGSRDAGCLMITKEAFAKTGGWNEELSLLAEKDFYDRMGKAGVRQIDTCKVMISHIMAATNRRLLEEDYAEYNRRMEQDAININ